MVVRLRVWGYGGDVWVFGVGFINILECFWNIAGLGCLAGWQSCGL